MRRGLLFVILTAWGTWAAAAATAPSKPYRPDDFTAVLLHFDEGQREVARDAGEFGLDATLRGARWAEGRFGSGLDCHRGGAIVQMHPALAPRREVTIEAWVFLDGASEELQRIVYRSSVYGLYLGARSTRLTFYVKASDKWEAVHADVPTGRWVHLAGTYDGERMRVYVGGKLRGERAKSGLIAESRVPLEIGGETKAGRRHLQGRVDEVRVSAIARERFDADALRRFEPTVEAKPIPVPQKPVKREKARGAKAATLVGLVRDEDGDRVRGVRVETPAGTRRTDVFGLFRAEDLPRGKVRLVIRTPRYHPLAVEAELQQATERVLLPPLREVNPNALTVDMPASERGYRVYTVAPLDDLDPATLPPSAQEGQPLTAFAAPEEYEPLGAAMYASRKLTGVEVTVSGLRGPGGASIAGEALDLRLVKRYFRRKWYHSPADDVVLASRYLLRPTSFDMEPQTFRRLHLIVHVPRDAPGGTYCGTLHIRLGNAPASELPVELEVLPIRLGPPKKHYALYYYGRHREVSEEQREAIIRAELADIREHGADRLLWRPRIGYRREEGGIAFDYDDVRRHVELLREHGFQPPYIVWTGFPRLAKLVGSEASEEFLREGERALRGLERLAEQEGWGEVVVTHMDEVFGRDRLDRYIRLTRPVRRVAGLRMYITLHTRPTAEVEAMTRRIDPFVDIRGYHGHSIDLWLAAGHTFAELGRELETSGDEAWCYYNPRSVDVTPEWQRIVNGLWMWLGPITTHCPWIYNSYRGDPLDDRDGFDYGYAFPVDGGVVGTRLWEGYREGVDDLRYLSTLERLIAQRKSDPEARDTVREARAFLEGLRKRLLALPLDEEQSALVRAIAEKHSAADYDGWRRQCAELIMRLQPGPN